MRLENRLILALDVDSFLRAKYFIDKLYPGIKIYKVGLQLFSACGRKIIDYIHKKKAAQVFLDLKYHDIPNTVSNAVRQAVSLKVKMLTLHISGGVQMIAAAEKSASAEAKILGIKRPLLIGVTVLTSKVADSREVLRLARMGIDSGLDGIVCSAGEVKMLRTKIRKKFITVTPGIRPIGTKAGDQKRTATAAQAIEAGSDYLVVGRPILEAKDPKEALADMEERRIRCQKI